MMNGRLLVMITINNRPMNKRQGNIIFSILFAGLLLVNGAAMAQRAEDQHVSVGGNVFGGGKKANVHGSSTVLIDQTGAIVGSDVYGGGEMAKVNTTDGTTLTDGKSTNVTLRVGTVQGNLYGGGLGVRPSGDDPGTPADVFGPVQVTINGGTVSGSVFGCNNLFGAPQTTVVVDVLKDPNNVVMNLQHNVYGGGNLANYTAPSGNLDYPVVNIKHGTVGGSVFGGGLGASAAVIGNPQVTIGDDNTNHTAVVNGNVYGGGDEAAVTGSTTVMVQNAHSQVGIDVYGGGNQANVSGSTVVTINNGTIVQDVYGGGALADVGTNASNTTTVDILGGTVQRAVYGGGLGRKAGEGITPVAAKVNGVVTVNIGKLNPTNNNDTIGAATLIGASVYGGNNANGSPQDNVFVNIWKTAHINTDMASYLENDRTYAIDNVFGGGNAAHYNPADGKQSIVHIYGCYNTIQQSYGGGNAADTPGVKTIIDGGRLDQVFGGGNGEAGPPGANINGDVDLEIHGGYIGQFYGASNQYGAISGEIHVDVDSEGSCGELTIDELFCGGNFANITGNVITNIGCSDGMSIGSLYGGCNQATIWGNVKLTVEGGTYNYIYGGSKGVAGGISADILDNPDTPEVEGNITLNVHGGTIRRAIFGGSNINGKVAGKIIVNVEDLIQTDECVLDVSICDVYGGGNEADYEPTNSGTDDYPQVNIKHATVKNVFGGGYKAKVEGNPQIKIKNRAKILGNVYGGGNMGVVEGQPKVTINGKDITPNPTGL